MGHGTGVVGGIIIGFHVGAAIYLLTLNITVALLAGSASFLFSTMLFTGLVYIRDEIRKKENP